MAVLRLTKGTLFRLPIPAVGVLARAGAAMGLTHAGCQHYTGVVEPRLRCSVLLLCSWGAHVAFTRYRELLNKTMAS